MKIKFHRFHTEMFPSRVLKYVFTMDICENFAPGISQGKSFSQMCVDIYLLSEEFWENLVSQISPIKGFFPVFNPQISLRISYIHD